MIDLILGTIAVVTACVVVLGWRWLHRQHQEVQAVDQAAQQARVGAASPGLRTLVSEVSPETPPADDWSVPLPVHVPRPTYWPAVLALGVTWMAWGAVSSLLVTLAGAGIFVLALSFWIEEMCHAERADRNVEQ